MPAESWVRRFFTVFPNPSVLTDGLLAGVTGGREVLPPPFTVLVLVLILMAGRLLAGVLLGGRMVFLGVETFLGTGSGVTFLGGVGVGTGATFFGGRGVGSSGVRFR